MKKKAGAQSPPESAQPANVQPFIAKIQQQKKGNEDHDEPQDMIGERI